MGNHGLSAIVRMVTMTKKLLFVVSIMLVLAMVLVGADAITGKWVFEQPMGRGGMGGGGGAPGGGAPGGGAPGGGAPAPMQVTLDLKADGATLTGTILQPMGGRGGGMGGGGGAAPAAAPAPTPSPITNGKVNGSTITFDVTREGRNGPTTTKYEGTVSGSELKLKITREGQNGPQTSEVTAKKS